MNCPRCCKLVLDVYAHTCKPTEGWRKMETEIAELKRQLEEAKDSEALAISVRSQFEKMLHKQAETISGFEKQLAESQTELEAARRDAEYKQSQIDALMLEYCPNEMTPAQLSRWEECQRPAIEQAKGGV